MTSPLDQLVEFFAGRMEGPCPEGRWRLCDEHDQQTLLGAISGMPDAEILAAYYRLEGDCARSQVLCDEIERRHLDL
ncbi:MAG: hypothetical protein EOP84_36865 [Verrucomicrobiaceae bacterium]|nr:MAG: hypothetical protein EOP84_36865 [Verrucomicrobiaceae bacterium]